VGSTDEPPPPHGAVPHHGGPPAGPYGGGGGGGYAYGGGGYAHGPAHGGGYGGGYAGGHAAPQTADNSILERGRAEYKPYTGKVSKEYVKLGALKPDLQSEELVAKRANAERVKLFSKNLRVINKQQEEERQPAERSAAPGGTLSKRQKAKEYARHVPKPKPRAEEPDEEDEDGGAGGGGGGGEVEEVDALTLLERQHLENQRQAALIRAELGLG